MLPAEGAQVVADGRPAGRVTSARVSERLGRAVGLAWVEPEAAREGAAIAIRVGSASTRPRPSPWSRSTTRRARGCAREPPRLPLAVERGGRRRGRLAAARTPPAAGLADVSHLGKLELRGPLDRVEPGPGEELIRLRSDRGLLVTDGSPAAALERLAGAGVPRLRHDGCARRLRGFGRRRAPPADRARPARAAGGRVDRARHDGGHRSTAAASTFRIFVAQELGHYVAEVVLDVLRGLGR